VGFAYCGEGQKRKEGAFGPTFSALDLPDSVWQERMNLSPEAVIEAFHRALQADPELRHVVYRAKASPEGRMV